MINRSELNKLGNQLVESGNIKAAIESFSTLLNDRPNDLNMANRIGDLYTQIGDTSAASLLFARAAGGYIQKGYALHALAVIKKAHRHDPNNPSLAIISDMLNLGASRETKSIDEFTSIADQCISNKSHHNKLVYLVLLAEYPVDHRLALIYYVLRNIYNNSNPDDREINIIDFISSLETHNQKQLALDALNHIKHLFSESTQFQTVYDRLSAQSTTSKT